MTDLGFKHKGKSLESKYPESKYPNNSPATVAVQQVNTQPRKVVTTADKPKLTPENVNAEHVSATKIINQPDSSYEDKHAAIARLVEIAESYPNKKARIDYQLARCFNFGLGVPVNKELAFELYQDSSSAGYKFAHNNLGNCYRHGIGVEPDPKKAFESYQQGSLAGDKSAHLNLGFCYSKAIGVEHNPKKAFELYQQGSLAGDKASHNNLGYCYQNGIGVEPDLQKAIYFYEKAYLAGHPIGMEVLDFLCTEGDNIDVHKRGAALFDDPTKGPLASIDIRILGYCKAKVLSNNIPPNHEEALYWYIHSADEGNQNAKKELPKAYLNVAIDNLSKNNFAPAIQHYKKAKKLGASGDEVTMFLPNMLTKIADLLGKALDGGDNPEKHAQLLNSVINSGIDLNDKKLEKYKNALNAQREKQHQEKKSVEENHTLPEGKNVDFTGIPTCFKREQLEKLKRKPRDSLDLRYTYVARDPINLDHIVKTQAEPHPPADEISDNESNVSYESKASQQSHEDGNTPQVPSPVTRGFAPYFPDSKKKCQEATVPAKALEHKWRDLTTCPDLLGKLPVTFHRG